MLNLLYHLKINVSKLLIPYLIKFRAYKLLSILLIINLSKIKKISPKQKVKYKVIVLNKSGGTDDLIESQKRYNNNFLYLSCPRDIFNSICETMLGKGYDNDKEFFSKKFIKKRKKYQNFLIILLKELKKNYNFKAFITFNFNYLSEIDLHAACEKSKIPCLMLYKESVATEIVDKYRNFFLKKTNQKFNGHKIAVYSNLGKNFLINSGVSKKKQIEVIGCSRLNRSFLYKKITPENQIIYYSIEGSKGISTYFKIFGKKFFNEFKKHELRNPKYDLQKLHFKIVNILKNFAKKNHNVLILIKIKIGDNYNEKLYNNLPENIKILYTGVGHKFLKKSKIVIGWNTTAILEGIAANRFILMPYFFKKNIKLKKKDELNLNLSKKSYAHSEKDFYDKLYYLTKKKYNINKTYNNQSSIKYYLGNSDNRAGLRLDRFLKKNILHTYY